MSVLTSDRFMGVQRPAEQQHGWSAERWLITGLAVAAVGWFLWRNIGHDLIRYIKISSM